MYNLDTTVLVTPRFGIYVKSFALLDPLQLRDHSSVSTSLGLFFGIYLNVHCLQLRGECILKIDYEHIRI